MDGRRGIRLKGLRRVQQDGKLYIYHRATGTRLPDLPENDPEFLAAYIAAESGEGKANNGTLRHVWQSYQRSSAYTTLSDSYRALMKRDGDALSRKGGHVPMAQIRSKHIRADMAELKVFAARRRFKSWRAICKHALTLTLIDVDPSEGVRPPAAPKATQHAPWSPDDIAAYRAHWPVDAAQRRAFELLFWTGARISDAVNLSAQMVDGDGWLTYQQAKTGGTVSIPLFRQPPRFADSADLEYLRAALAVSPHDTWLSVYNGRPRSVKAASQWFSAAARAAGLKNRTAHGLRVTRAIRLAEGGATTHQIGAWTGHESLAEIAHYSRAADKRRLLSVQDFDS